MQIIRQLADDEQGAITAEYSLVLLLIVVAGIASLIAVRDQIIQIFADATDRLTWIF